MGTRADFYVGRGKDAEWLGSVAWDGNPSNGDYAEVWRAGDERTFRIRVGELLARRDDGTLPEHGWPWPWEDSGTTDWAYAFDEGTVWATFPSRPWVRAETFLAWAGDDEERYVDGEGDGEAPVFPNMKHVQNATLGPRSGVMIMGAGPEID